MKFETGDIYMTAGIAGKFQKDIIFMTFIIECIKKYREGNWGVTEKEDCKRNEIALENGERIFAVYKDRGKKIWIITEWNRSYTTIMFPEEY